MKNKYIFLAAIALGLLSCKPEINDGFEPSAGKADFSNYVALGNSLTAGYADGALYRRAQEQSWTNLLATQFKEVGGGEFVQPAVMSEQGILPGKLKLAVVNGSLAPVPAEDGDLEAFFPPLNYTVNNLGVPGAKVSHLLAPGYGNIENLAAGLANPYYIRFATTPNTTVIEQALAMNPTFFSLWIGNNDVLGYASSGGAGDFITPLADFTNYYGALAQTLASTGAKGVLANIPEITSAAYFNTVPNNALEIDATTAAQMNLGLSFIEGQMNAILSQAGLPEFSYNIEFKPGANLFLIEDNNFIYGDLLDAIADTTTDPLNKLLMQRVQFRQMTASELLTLRTPQDSLAMGMGSFMAVDGIALPLPFGIPNKYVLDADEMHLVATTINSYNTVIKNTAEQYDWALVDVNSIFNEVKDGITVDGINLNADFVSGGVFSLDGIHLSPRGNAMVSNYFIQAINKKYNSAISTVNISAYNGVEFP
ncbi:MULTISPECIES: G-D-S-L family lipolytic protein [unclassified Lentimicrobium]|uniref:G-D-S-L family lipolytic protein n=1 Tax=unclassified Lentimicrobium TaxID=2677434 RepID=UPI0015574590|nr:MULTISPECIES: G-D-S-L family lipolytic protein [unclassified Lentimicrobium]NPD46600.1 G-D-S-L family lipolytic protein [Lentimicrobium sp. S6]NPD83819.1 G-D-S-L family lipolytic protein [Lentimicrobium sp. L6]